MGYLIKIANEQAAPTGLRNTVAGTVAGTVLGGTLGRLTTRRRPGESEQDFQARRRRKTMTGAFGGGVTGGVGTNLYGRYKNKNVIPGVPQPKDGDKAYVDSPMEAKAKAEAELDKATRANPATAISGETSTGGDRSYTKESLPSNSLRESQSVIVNHNMSLPNPRKKEDLPKGLVGGGLRYLNKKLNPFA